MVDKTIYWTFPRSNETCSNSLSPEIQSCYGQGKCKEAEQLCYCTHKYGDPVSFCQYQYFDIYHPAVVAFPIVRDLPSEISLPVLLPRRITQFSLQIGIVLTAILMMLFALELAVDLRLKRCFRFRTPIGIAKVIMFPYLISAKNPMVARPVLTCQF